MSVAIIAALPREIAGLVAGLKADAALRKGDIFLYRKNDNVIAAAGMGRDRVALAVAASRDAAPVEKLISVGLAGACSTSLKPGTLLRAGIVVDSLTGERFETAEDHAGVVLVSTEEIASIAEKERLRQSYSASMVDMEAATVARLARAYGLAFHAVKGISDSHDFELANLSRFANERGHFRTRRFALHTAVRPHTWGAAITLGRHSKAALALLSDALLPLINT